MGAAKGNKNALGNRGGGRKSAYQERANAEELASMFFHAFSSEEIQAQARKHSVRDAMVMKAWSGDVKAQTAIFNKLFPDITKMNVEHSGKVEITPEIRQFASELAQKLKNADR